MESVGYPYFCTLGNTCHLWDGCDRTCTFANSDAEYISRTRNQDCPLLPEFVADNLEERKNDMKKQLTEEMSSRYGFTLAEMDRIMKLTLECSNRWDTGEWNKSQIVDHIIAKTDGNIRMGVLTGMATGAMMETHASVPSVNDLLAALKGLDK